MTCGIYLLTNKINGKVYVGQSTDIEGRFKKYWGYGPDKNQTKLRRAFEKYGADAFTREILEVCELDVDVLNKAEVRWGLQLRAIRDGYNCQLGGRGNLIMGDDTRQKISEARRADSANTDRLVAMNKSRIGQMCSEEHRRKISDASKKRWSDPEYRQRVADSVKIGWDQDARRRAAESQKGRKHTEETRRKMSESRLKKEEDPSYKRKQGESQRKKWEDPKYKRRLSESIKDAWNVGDRRKNLGDKLRMAWADPARKKRRVDAMMGRKFSEESKRKMSEAQRDHSRDARIKADLAMGRTLDQIADDEGMRPSSIRRILDRFKRDGVMVSHMLAASHRPMPVGPWHTIEMFT